MFEQSEWPQHRSKVEWLPLFYEHYHVNADTLAWALLGDCVANHEVPTEHQSGEMLRESALHKVFDVPDRRVRVWAQYDPQQQQVKMTASVWVNPAGRELGE